jgi:hypothetical protein
MAVYCCGFARNGDRVWESGCKVATDADVISQHVSSGVGMRLWHLQWYSLRFGHGKSIWNSE